MRKGNDFPNLSRLQMLTGWVVCRTWCINAERVVVRICYGRGCWQAVGLPGLVAQTCTAVMSQAVRSAGKIEFHTVFHDARTPTACATPEPLSTFLPSPSALTGWLASGIVPVALVAGVDGLAFCQVWCINAERVVVRICYGRGCWQAVGLPGLVAQTGTGVLSQAVRSAGKIEFHTVFHDARTPTACAKSKRYPHSYQALQP